MLDRTCVLYMFSVAIAGLLFSSAAAIGSEPLKVMSFNIRYGSANDGEDRWDRRKEFVVETIKAFDPDLLGTQETEGSQRDFLQERLSGYAGLGVGRDDGDEKGEMMALFYKRERFEPLDEGHFWLSESPQQVGSKSWDSSLPRMCTWVKLRDKEAPELRPILFLNTHFDHRGPLARSRSASLIRRLASELGEDCDIVLTGDFNAAVDSEPYRELVTAEPAETRFIDTYTVAPPEGDNGQATFSGFRASIIEGNRIDWILVRGDWQVVSAAINRTSRDGRTPSDHYPIHAILDR